MPEMGICGRNYSCTHVMVGITKYIVCQPNLKLAHAITGLGQPIIHPWSSQYLRLKFGLTEKMWEDLLFLSYKNRLFISEN